MHTTLSSVRLGLLGPCPPLYMGVGNCVNLLMKRASFDINSVWPVTPRACSRNSLLGPLRGSLLATAPLGRSAAKAGMKVTTIGLRPAALRPVKVASPVGLGAGLLGRRPPRRLVQLREVSRSPSSGCLSACNPAEHRSRASNWRTENQSPGQPVGGLNSPGRGQLKPGGTAARGKRRAHTRRSALRFMRACTPKHALLLPPERMHAQATATEQLESTEVKAGTNGPAKHGIGDGNGSYLANGQVAAAISSINSIGVNGSSSNGNSSNGNGKTTVPVPPPVISSVVATLTPAAAISNGNGSNGNGAHSSNGNGTHSSNGTTVAAARSAAPVASSTTVALTESLDMASDPATAGQIETVAATSGSLLEGDVSAAAQNAEIARQAAEAKAAAERRATRSASGTPYKNPGGKWAKFKSYSTFQVGKEGGGAVGWWTVYAPARTGLLVRRFALP